jgi:N-acetylmuramoyl-L-alanine amidase
MVRALSRARRLTARGALLVALGLLACTAPPPSPPVREAPLLTAPPAPVAPRPRPVLAGAEPLEGELEAALAVEEPAAESEDGADAGPEGGLPRWLRPVRVPEPPKVIGTGRAWPKRVGLQVGHWGSELLPDELARLRDAGGGASGGGYTEVQVNYAIAQLTAALLQARGLAVDVLPATVPQDYLADAFVAIHADGDARGRLRGFKIARSALSHIPEVDDALVEALYVEYARYTGLPRDDDHVTPRMRYYYAFNNRRYYHAIATGTPAAIVETGFITSAEDRALLVNQPERAAAGLAAGILRFLGLCSPAGDAGC